MTYILPLKNMAEKSSHHCLTHVDEAYHAVASNYQNVIKRMTTLNSNRVLLGLTATPTRMQESQKIKLC